MGDNDSVFLDSDWDLSCSEETTTCGSWTVSCCNVAKLSRSSFGSQPVDQPKIVSASSGNNSCLVAVDKVCVYISENQEVLRIPLKNKIDDLALLTGGYVVIGDAGGSLMTAVIQPDVEHGLKLSIKSSQKLVQTKNGYDGPSFQRVLISQELDGCSAQIVVLTVDGQLVTVSGIKLLEGDMDISNASISKTSVPSSAIDVVNCNGTFFLLDHHSTISIWEFENSQLVMAGSTVYNEGFELTHILPTREGDAFFTLDEGGNLYLWDVLTVVPVCLWALCDIFKAPLDVRIVHAPGNDDTFNVTDIKLVVCADQTVNVMKLATLESCFEQKNEGNILLTKSHISQDDIYVTECKMDYDEDDQETFTCIKFMCFTETSPEHKLMKLIARKRFEEAEQLIKLYGLKFNLVPHLVQQRMYEALPTFDETQELLQSCRRQIDGCDEDEENLVRHASHELSILEHRLTSYGKVFGKERYSPFQWQKFQQANIFHMSFELLSSENPESAFSLWRCFQVDCAMYLTGQRIPKMLQLSSKSAPAEKLLDWLCIDIIPFLVYETKQAWINIVDWTIEFVAAMEYENEDEWPSCAISFCEAILGCSQQKVECDIDETALLWDDKMNIDGDCLLKPLRELLGSLRTLATLKSRFQCDFSLEIIKKETKESIVYRMLDKLASVEMLDSTLKLQIRPYIRYCGLNADNIFAQYVKDLLERLVQGRAKGSGWECKIQSLIDIIEGPKEKVLAVLNLVNNAPLPLASFVRDVVENIIDLISHPLIPKLQQSWCMKEADNLMVAYGLEVKPITSAQAKDVATYFIIQDKSLSIEDARRILKGKKMDDETFLAVRQTNFYMRNEKLPELLKMIKGLSSDLGKACSEYCMGLAEMILTEDVSEFGQKMKSTILKYCSAGMLVANYQNFSSNDELQLAQNEITLQKIQSAKTLLDEFDIGMNCHTLDDENHCMDIFKNHFDKLTENVVFRFARLLGIYEDVAAHYLIERAVNQKDFDSVDFLIGKFSCDQSQKATDAKMKTAEYLFNSRLMAAAYALSSKESAICLPRGIKRWMVLSQQAKFMKQLCHYSQSKSGKVSLKIPETMKTDDDSFDLGVGDWYEETRLPFQNDSIVEDTGHLLQVLRSEEWDNGSSTQVAMEIVPCLSAHGHDQLALRLLSSHLQARQETDCLSLEQTNPPLTELVAAWKRTCTQMLSKILRSVPLDYKQALGLALVLPRDECVAILSREAKSSSSNFQLLKRVCMVGVAIAEILQDEHLTKNFALVYQKAKWGHRLSKLGISFKDALEGSRMQSLHIVECLIKHPQCSMAILKEYFVDLKLESAFIQDSCVKFFRSLLLPLGPTPTTLERAHNVLENIQDESQQLSLIKNLFAETSSYNYEVLQFLLELWQMREESIDFKGIDLLRMLKLYKRRSPPTEIEFEEELAVDGQAVDSDSVAVKLSHERLPFHSLMSKKPWKFIGPELHMDNLQFWLSVISVIGVPKDDLLIKVAQNLVKTYTESRQTGNGNASSQLNVSTDRHELSTEFLNMMKDLNQVLSQVERLEGAVLWSHATADKLQRVEEKVIALKCSMNLAEKWLEKAEQPTEKKKAERAHKILSIKLPPLSTQWSLMKCGLWSNEGLRSLIKQPKELINQLYQLPHPDAMKDQQKDKQDTSFEGKTNWEQAIHEACDEISEFNRLDLLEIQANLLNSWLMSSNSSADPDQTMTFDMCSPEINSPESILKKIHFLLKSSNGHHHLTQVKSVAEMREGPMSLASRKMAVACLLKAVSDDDMKEMVDKSQQELQHQLKVLTQLSILEKYNMAFTPETFQQIDKLSLVQSLFSRLRYYREVVPVIASICLDNSIYDPDLWDSILQQMVKLNLRDSLIPIIVRLCNVKNIDSIRSTPGFLQSKGFVSSASS